MTENYPVFLRGKPAGSVMIEKQGLYYRIFCSCELSQNSVCRLMLKSGEETTKIGVLIPENGMYRLDKRIPVKNLTLKAPEFFLTLRADMENRIFIPVCSEEPFAYLARLQDAFLGYQDDKIGVWLPK